MGATEHIGGELPESPSNMKKLPTVERTLRGDPEQIQLVVDPRNVKFRIKERPGNFQCRWQVQIKLRVWWFIWSDWHDADIENGNMVKYGPRCTNNLCSMEQAKKMVDDMKHIFRKEQEYNHKNLTETVYYEM